jgi:hypothetical protein
MLDMIVFYHVVGQIFAPAILALWATSALADPPYFRCRGGNAKTDQIQPIHYC